MVAVRMAEHCAQTVRLAERGEAVDRPRRELEVIRQLLDVLLDRHRHHAADQDVDARIGPRDTSEPEHRCLFGHVSARGAFERNEVRLCDLDAVLHRRFANRLSTNSR